MGVLTGPGGGEVPAWWAERNNKQASQLLNMLEAAKSVGKMGAPSLPRVGGDHPKPQGLLVELLFGPGQFVWPPDSETQLAKDADTLGQEERFHEEKGLESRQAADRVFSGGAWAGKSADAAEAAYRKAASARFYQAEIARVAKGLIGRVAGDVERTKRKMTEESDAAHQEAEKFLKSGSGKSIAAVAAIVSKHRVAIQAQSADLHANVANDTLLFTDQFSLSPNGGSGPKVEQAGNDLTPDHSTDPAGAPAPGPPGSPSTAPGVNGVRPDASTPGPAGPPQLPGGRIPGHSSDGGPGPVPRGPLTSLLGAGSGLPSLPGGGGGTGFPMSLLSGFGGFPGGGIPPTAGFSSPAALPPSVPGLGMDFGRGLAAGATAVGTVPPTPQAPMTALTVPVESTTTLAAPAAASGPAPAPAATPAPVVAPGMPAGGLTPYGSVLPPSAPPASPGSAPVPPSIPAEGGGGSSAPGPGPGLMPVAGRRDGALVRRDLAESDLELARTAVAELAGAAKVTDPGLDWAVAVGRNRTSGMTTLWVATNDGATYIPPGVYLLKTMPVAAKFDEDFDARWFGWVNPADKAVRAARALGDDVGAVATTWAWPSDYLGEHPAVREVATGVAPGGLDTPAAELLPSRSHRLQTVDAALYGDLKAADESVVRDYCRELVRRLAFGVGGDELSPVAQSVAHALVAQRWPKVEEWAALSVEYETALVLMGAQRPGLSGVEDPDQMISYAKLFANCRRLEALLSWDRHDGDLANVVYAAWVAGVRASLNQLVPQ